MGIHIYSRNGIVIHTIEAFRSLSLFFIFHEKRGECFSSRVEMSFKDYENCKRFSSDYKEELLSFKWGLKLEKYLFYKAHFHPIYSLEILMFQLIIITVVSR